MKNASKPETRLSPKKVFFAILIGVAVALVLIAIISAIIWVFLLQNSLWQFKVRGDFFSVEN